MFCIINKKSVYIHFKKGMFCCSFMFLDLEFQKQ